MVAILSLVDWRIRYLFEVLRRYKMRELGTELSRASNQNEDVEKCRKPLISSFR
jgi:hypothetical protein